MRWVVLLGFFTISISSFSQEKQEDLIENALNEGSNEEESIENENIIEDLIFLSTHPVNINDTLLNHNILYQYDLLTPLQSEQLKEYIRRHGDLITKKEVYAVPFISYEQAKDLFPYIITKKGIEERISLKNQLQHSRKSLVVRHQFLIEDQKGFKSADTTESKYLGDKSRLYFKYRQQYRDVLSFGFLGDKDAGEEFFKGSNESGFDFYSAHFAYKPEMKLVNQAIVGDYEVKIGQGLVQWNGFALGKGSDATTVFQKGPRIRPYTSANEYNFLRGITAELQLTKDITSQVWLSRKNIDANSIQLDTINTDFIEVTSLQTSGLHRTTGEIEDKGAIKETIMGANIAYEKDWWNIGLTMQQRGISEDLVYSTRDYQKFFPRGDRFHNTGIHYSGIKNNLYFFGETAMGNNQSFATINGIQKYFDSGIKASLVYRNYGKSYESFYASSLSENTRINNEKGVYLGLSYSPIRALKLQMYYDQFWFPWNKARVDRPSQGTEWFLRADYQHANSEIEFRSRIENKETDLVGNTLPNNEITRQERITNRIEFRHRPNEWLYLKTRVGHTAFKNTSKSENGYLLFQDVVYEFPEKPVKLYGRLAAFNTPSFDSRIYAYENDLLYNFSVPAYYGKGVRWYAMASASPFKRIKIWIKGGQTVFNDREIISSGNNEIDGNTRTEIKMQLQWKF